MRVPRLLLFAPLISARVVQSRQQLPVLANEPAPSIGVHFTTSYAVAAARYENGTTRDLLKIEGDAEYIGLMSRWMDLWNADPSIRNLQTLPTTKDADILSKFLSRVRTAIETGLDTPITYITPTTFPLRPAQEQVFQDALITTELASTDHMSKVYTEAETAYITLQHNSPQPCPLTQTQNILFLSFDNSSFSASTYQLSCHPNQQLKFINFYARSDLGWWNMPVDDLPRARFWSRVQDCITDVIDGLGKPPGRIVMLGSHGGEEEFKGVVEEVLWREWEVDISMMVRGQEVIGSAGREWIAARVAAGMVLLGR
jgi:hypothetical protein